MGVDNDSAAELAAANEVSGTNFVAAPSTPKEVKKELVEGQPVVAEDVVLAVHKNDPEHPLYDPPTVGMIDLFSFADKTDYILMAIGTFSAIISGLVQPALLLVFGDTLDAFNLPPDSFKSEVLKKLTLMVVFAAIAFVAGYGQVTFWMMTAERQARRIRQQYLEAILRQEVGWFDFRVAGELISSTSEKTATIQEGLGRKWGDGIQFISMFIGGFALGFYKGWLLTLVLCAALPPLAITGWYMTKTIADASKSIQLSYAQAGGVASEVISSIRTVVSFGGQKTEVERYYNALQGAEKAGIIKGFQLGLSAGLVFFVAFASYALGLWFGARLVANDREDKPECASIVPQDGADCFTGGKVLTVFFCVIVSSMAVGQATPSFSAVASARAAASSIFHVIRRKSKIDPMTDAGTILKEVQGKVELKNIVFSYPTRPSVQICNGYSFTVEPGQTVALVGHSGSGKSTAVALLERFYDPQSGTILLDGHDTRDLNLRWLRSQIGLVGQEPVLFSGTIAENIGHGKPGCTREEIEEAARMSNAHAFISAFPQGFETEVGEKGAQLSGGQKQRIAIARAIIRNPALLLLDEATSALDNESERIVQDSLDRLIQQRQRTTIVIAHRLSTVRNANKIIVFEKGNIMEEGTHDELMALNGVYMQLVNRQVEATKPKDAVEEEEEVEEALIEEEARVAHLSSVKDDKVIATSTMISKDSTLGALEEGAIDEEVVKKIKIPYSRLWKLNASEWKELIVGSIGALLNGAVFPLWGLLIAKMIAVFFDVDPQKIRDDSVFFACMFLVVAVGVLIGNVLQFWCFAIAGERLTRRVRLLVFKAVLRQEIGFFDKDENSSGNICSRLSEDATIIQSQVGESLARNVANVMTLAVGLGLSFYYSWELTLIMLCVFPLLAFAGWVQMAVFSGSYGNSAAKTGGSVVSEGVINIRTVAAMNLESTLLDRYAKAMEGQVKHGVKQGQIAGLGFGASQFIMFGAYAFVFWYGSNLMTRDDGRKINFEAMLIVIMVIMLAAFGFGNAAQNMTDAVKAKKAIYNVFTLIDRVPKIDSESEEGVEPSVVRGEINFEQVHFCYPSRPDAKVCRGYNFTVAPGQTVALVGSSGSGKSTAVNLLERYYDPDLGSITLDGVSLRDLNVQWLRAQIGLVGQEPVLFTGSIADNIVYGKRGATREDVIQAAIAANAHTFISALPDGYDTQVGEKGVQLSGGQKQRVAIARAVIRNPALLLLDEATSALDSESEEVVQRALDELMAVRNCTTIVIAHRLSTIRNADKIMLIEKGKIVESGSHDELMAKKGKYAQLVATKMK